MGPWRLNRWTAGLSWLSRGSPAETGPGAISRGSPTEMGLSGFSLDGIPLSAVVDLYITPSGTVDLFLKKETQPNKYFLGDNQWDFSSVLLVQWP